MVYDKNRSGDPDYDDKQPPEFHAGGEVVMAGDGVRLSPVTGPTDAEGAHVNLSTTTDDLDNRPSPGNVAKSGSLVQDYLPEDTPTVGKEVEADRGDVAVIESAQASVQAANLANSGVPGLTPDTQFADESHTRTADITADKGGAASASTPVRKSSSSK